MVGGLWVSRTDPFPRTTTKYTTPDPWRFSPTTMELLKNAIFVTFFVFVIFLVFVVFAPLVCSDEGQHVNASTR